MCEKKIPIAQIKIHIYIKLCGCFNTIQIYPLLKSVSYLEEINVLKRFHGKMWINDKIHILFSTLSWIHASAALSPFPWMSSVPTYLLHTHTSAHLTSLIVLGSGVLSPLWSFHFPHWRKLATPFVSSQHYVETSFTTHSHNLLRSSSAAHWLPAPWE